MENRITIIRETLENQIEHMEYCRDMSTGPLHDDLRMRINSLQDALTHLDTIEASMKKLLMSDEEIWDTYPDFITWLTTNQVPRNTVRAVDPLREHFRDAIRYTQTKMIKK